MPKKNKRSNIETLRYCLSAEDRISINDIRYAINNISTSTINMIEDNSCIYGIDTYCDFEDSSNIVDLYLNIDDGRFNKSTLYV